MIFDEIMLDDSPTALALLAKKTEDNPINTIATTLAKLKILISIT